jgi:succinate-semialdehyde dehydrogenase / glutarate-semialdehyde dehydrogenase
LYVHEKVYDKFAELLKKKVAEFKLGFGLDPQTTQGPLVNASAVKKVLEHVNDAKSKGAQVIIGGKAPEHLKGFFFEPTILTGMTKEMVVSNDETFGPLAPLFKFGSDQEVIEMANDTEFGLAGYFFSKDFNRVWRVAAALEVGMVGVNTGKISAPESPFGGVCVASWVGTDVVGQGIWCGTGGKQVWYCGVPEHQGDYCRQLGFIDFCLWIGVFT